MNLLKAICSLGFIRKIITGWFTLSDAGLQRSAFGLTFKNPVGLGAGFDKNAKYLRDLETLGFGFVEMGSDEEAKAAIAQLDGKDLNGRAISVNEARPRPPREERSFR